MKILEERLAQIETRLERIDRLLPAMSAKLARAPVDEPVATVQPRAPAVVTSTTQRRVMDPQYGNVSPVQAGHGSLSVTQILGWTGATAVAVRPLKMGKHTIKFAGRYNNTTSDFGRMVQHTEYEISVGELEAPGDERKQTTVWNESF